MYKQRSDPPGTLPIASGVVLLVICAIMLILPQFDAGSSSDAAVCDGQVMQKGDVCIRYDNDGNTQQTTYEEELQKEEWGRTYRPLMGIASGLVGLCLLAWGIAVKRRSRRPTGQ